MNINIFHNSAGILKANASKDSITASEFRTYTQDKEYIVTDATLQFTDLTYI